jgi:hypothetical protein
MFRFHGYVYYCLKLGKARSRDLSGRGLFWIIRTKLLRPSLLIDRIVAVVSPRYERYVSPVTRILPKKKKKSNNKKVGRWEGGKVGRWEGGGGGSRACLCFSENPEIMSISP